MNKGILRLLPFADVLLAPFVFTSAFLLKKVRGAGVEKLPHCKSALLKAGVFPIRNHYYEPQFDYRQPQKREGQERALPGINWNIKGQLELLERFNFARELAGIPLEQPNPFDFHMRNVNFTSGDAEYWYQLIRATKPKRIFEVGSGYSTLMAIKAIRKNTEQDPNFRCRHVCIEPYEMDWLEKTGVSVVRTLIEDLEVEFFAELEDGDILFIDSSHMIRPEGDVLFEILDLLPTLRKGVVVHFHDIFSPRNYPKKWLVDELRFWNEQYLVETLLSYTQNWEIAGALNYLHHHHYEELKAVAPFLTPDREPGSFYIRKIV